MESNDLYSIYFIPYIILVITVLIPIPTAVVFDWFRTKWTKILLEDRMREKESLFLSFVCLDYDWKGFINMEKWLRLIGEIYKGINDIEKTMKVFETVDNKKIGYIDVE